MSSNYSEEISMLDRLSEDCVELLDELEDKCDAQQVKIIKKYVQRIANKYEGVPEFAEDLDWFNVMQPLKIEKHLLGSVVLLDFFTYCCINCLHILPNLKKLEEKFPITEGFTVIGVHNAKFQNEKRSSNIKAACERHNITHPVVNDVTGQLWKQLNVQCWPTMIILGPNANPLFVIMGEGSYQRLENYVSGALEYYREQNEINPYGELRALGSSVGGSSKLRYPGKMQGLPEHDIYAMSDSGNHRVLVFDGAGKVLHKIGGKLSGFKDGNFKECRFDSPQGVAFLSSDILYVADTENHAIRMVDLAKQTVNTVAGTGAQGFDKVGGAAGPTQALSSPWDLAIYKTKNMDMSFHIDDTAAPLKPVLFIAMAGTHQLWAYFIEDTIWWRYKLYKKTECAAIAGNGEERNRNNSYPNQASFAQPSGLTVVKENYMFIADSESSTIRKMAFLDGKVSAVVGGNLNPLNLFAFGDVDGAGLDAKLQHPLGLTYHAASQTVYVVDTYNHKLKRINLQNNYLQTVDLGDFKFLEPSDVCSSACGGFLFVVNTNAHQLVKVELSTNQCEEFKLDWDEVEEDEDVVDEPPADFVLVAKPIEIHESFQNQKLPIKFTLEFESGVKLTLGAPHKASTSGAFESTLALLENGSSVLYVDSSLSEVSVDLRLYLCRDELCFKRDIRVQIPIHKVDGGMMESNHAVNVLVTRHAAEINESL